MEINENKKSKTYIMAENKKNKEIKFVFKVRDEMISNNIDEKVIKQYIEEEYKKIINEYNEKIIKYNEKQSKQNKNQNKLDKIKRNKEIEIILKNKYCLEEKGYNSEYIKKYVDRQYNEINKKYNYSVNLPNIDFID